MNLDDPVPVVIFTGIPDGLTGALGCWCPLEFAKGESMNTIGTTSGLNLDVRNGEVALRTETFVGVKDYGINSYNPRRYTLQNEPETASQLRYAHSHHAKPISAMGFAAGHRSPQATIQKQGG